MDPIAIISLAVAALGLPAAVIGIIQLKRYLRRRNLTTQSELDKERAYLFAFQGYLEEIERPTQFLEDEFTPLAGSLLEREHVALRYLVRSATPQDQLGLQSPDIAPTSKGRHV